jgi:4-amino-4-deoxy-L-arabinose transferase-like glycosyltransferase
VNPDHFLFQGHRPWRAWIALILICLLVQLPGLLSMPVTDRDEARFAQASKQMVETGDYVNINLQDEPRHKKPIGIYWLQAGAVHLFGSDARPTIAVYRLPSLLAAIASTLLTFSIGAVLFSRPVGFLAALFMATCAVQIGEAMLAKTDATQCAFILLSLWALAQSYKGPTSRAIAAVFWVGIGGAILVKGPVGPTVLGLSIISLSIATRKALWLKNLRPIMGLAIVAAITLPWFIAIGLATDWAFFERAIGGDLAPKLRQGGDLWHGAPPLYHLALLPAVFWPASLFALPGVVKAWQDRRHSTGVLFCLCWLVPSWILFELVPNKLPHYTLPLLPALAILSAYALVNSGGAGRKISIAAFALWLVPTLALIGLSIAAPVLYGPQLTVLLLAEGARGLAAYLWQSGTAIPLLLLSAIFGLGIWHLLGHRREFSAPSVAIAGGIAIAAMLTLIGPNLDRLFLAPRLTHAVFQVDPQRHRPVAVIGYSEASVPFLLGTTTKLLDNGEAGANLLSRHPETLIFVEGRAIEAFLNVATQAGMSLVPLGQIDGRNYSNGREVSLTLFKNAATP